MFDAMKVKNSCVQWIRSWFEENGPECNAVIGISGGADSTVVAGLCVEALGKDRVIGVMMPNGIQPDIEDSLTVVRFLGIKNYVFNISDIMRCYAVHFPRDLTASDQTVTNLPPRIRMATLYAISQSCNGRVANTCNLSEDWVGYSTRWGDSVGDFAPLANLTKTEVIAIGDVLGLPEPLVHKTPSDGLCGKTDEDNLGFTYAALDEYIRTGVCEDVIVRKKIDALHEKNLFKVKSIPTFWPWIQVCDANCRQHDARFGQPGFIRW